MANLGKLAVAVLGILAYQNRDKIGELVRGAGASKDPNNPQGGLMDRVADGVSGTPLGDILEKFRNSGAGSKVDSWLRTGPNEPLDAKEVESVIDEETLTSLSRQTGLSRDELIARITAALPEAVDKMSPNGDLPNDNLPSGSETTLLDPVPPNSTRKNV